MDARVAHEDEHGRELKWTSKLFDKRWQIDAFTSMHSASRSVTVHRPQQPQRNQISGGNHDYEARPDARPRRAASNLARSTPTTRRAASARSTSPPATAGRAVKSTHVFDVGSHNEVKYGWHIDLGTFDLDRFYSGTPDGAFVQLYPPANFVPWTFFC